jgi:hypothetical protein
VYTNAPPAPGPLLPALVKIEVPLKAMSHLVEFESDEGTIVLFSKLKKVYFPTPTGCPLESPTMVSATKSFTTFDVSVLLVTDGLFSFSHAMKNKEDTSTKAKKIDFFMFTGFMIKN